MLPHPRNAPAHLPRSNFGIAIAGNVREDLGAPPFGVPLRPCPVSRTPVPKATIYENCEPFSGKNQIAASPESGQRVIDSESKPPTVKRASQGELGWGIAPPNILHLETLFWSCSRWCRTTGHPAILEVGASFLEGRWQRKSLEPLAMRDQHLSKEEHLV
jgi:hypothetical protein